MYKVQPVVNYPETDKLIKELFPDKEIILGLRFALFDDEKLIGAATVSCGEKIIIRAIGILPEYRKKGLGDFFTRSIMNGFTLSPEGSLYIGYVADYYRKFGFCETEDSMMCVKNSEIVFPSYCKGHKK